MGRYLQYDSAFQTSAHDAGLSQGSCGQLVWESFARLNIQSVLVSCSRFYCSSVGGCLPRTVFTRAPPVPRSGCSPSVHSRGCLQHRVIRWYPTPRSRVVVLRSRQIQGMRSLRPHRFQARFRLDHKEKLPKTLATPFPFWVQF